MTTTTTEGMEMERNWADLPPQLVPLILKNLPDLCDFVRSRAVCRAWRSSSSISDLPRQFPWIIRIIGEGPDLELYSIALNKLYTIRVDCSSDTRLFGAASCFMLTGQEGDVDSFSLLNPLNNSEIFLPVLHDCNPHSLLLKYPWFSHLSYQIDDYMLVSDYELSVVCKPGDDKWDIIGPGHRSLYCCYYFQGLCFRVFVFIEIIDISSLEVLYVIPPPKDEEMLRLKGFAYPYLIESCGEILAVCCLESYKTMDYKFFIHRLEFGNGKGDPCWVKVSSIGDRILFFHFPAGTGRGFCLKASDFAGFKGNCIYFINKSTNYPSGHNQVINMYDIQNGETVFIDTPFDCGNLITWFMPTLNHI
ncbi:putative F-box protein At1g44080 [Carex rostrata]